MSEVGDLEQRLSGALERIERGVAALAAADPGRQAGVEQADLAEELAQARTERDAMTERLQALQDEQNQTEQQLAHEFARLRNQLEEAEITNQRLRSVNARLRENNLQLREQNEAMVGDPQLVNAALRTELDALRVSHEADRAELDAVLSEMKPLLEES